MTYKQGDIILVDYLFTNQTESKKRPVIVISQSHLNKTNVIACKITTVMTYNENSFFLHQQNDLETPLISQSEARTNDLATIENTLIVRVISKMKKEALERLLEAIQKNIAFEY